MRYQTARQSGTRKNLLGGRNPYISDIFKEGEFLTASNAYHRLDKSQNFYCNKAFAHTILNDLKQKQRQAEFERRLGMLNEDSSLVVDVSKIMRHGSQQHFKKQQSAIYTSGNSTQCKQMATGADTESSK